MIQELKQNTLNNIAGGVFTGITSEISLPFGMDVACVYSAVLREMCDYAPCLPTLWVYA